MKLTHVVAKCEFYEKWIKETKAIDCRAKTVTINTVVETMVADEQFRKLEDDYEAKRDELQKKRREEYLADLENRRFGPPTGTQVTGGSVGSQDANSWTLTS